MFKFLQKRNSTRHFETPRRVPTPPAYIGTIEELESALNPPPYHGLEKITAPPPAYRKNSLQQPESGLHSEESPRVRVKRTQNFDSFPGGATRSPREWTRVPPLPGPVKPKTQPGSESNINRSAAAPVPLDSAISPSLLPTTFSRNRSLTSEGSPRMRPATIGETFSTPSSPALNPASIGTYLQPRRPSNAAASLVENDDLLSGQIYRNAIASLSTSISNFIFGFEAMDKEISGIVVDEKGVLLEFTKDVASTKGKVRTVLAKQEVPFVATATNNGVVKLTSIPEEGSIHVIYFQINILKLSKSSVMAIGLATRPYPDDKFPGHHRTSVAYSSKNGYKYLSNPSDGYPYATTYGEGDVVGCGYVAERGLVFFTKNGRGLGVAAFDWAVGQRTWPCIGVEGSGKVKLEFKPSVILVDVQQKLSVVSSTSMSRTSSVSATETDVF